MITAKPFCCLAVVLATALPLFAGNSASAEAPSRVIAGRVLDERGAAVPNATITIGNGSRRQSAVSDSQGQFRAQGETGQVVLEVSGPYLVKTTRVIPAGQSAEGLELQVKYVIPRVNNSLVITASVADPAIERRNDAVYKETLFSRDDQIFDTLAAGINAGQHEGGGKSIEVRRFGFNMDHGGVNGGLKVLVDDVQQNQGTQGHGQGYLGQLKSLSPELVEDVDILNGPFSAEYGDFSGLGVVHIRLKERLADRYTVRIQGGSFNAFRTFLAYSPSWKDTDAFLAYEGAHTDGPFRNPLRYVRHNITGNVTRHLDPQQSLGLKFNFGSNGFDSSGQIPLDEVQAGRMDRFSFVDPANGGHNRSATIATYYRRDFTGGDMLKVDGFVSRSLFDLWSNFTFYLNDPANGDEFLQHDSRLQEGLNAQYLHPWKLAGRDAVLTMGANYHDNQINVGLFPARDRMALPGAALQSTSADARVTNGAVYVQQALELVPRRLHAEVGLRFDEFRFDVTDRLGLGNGGTAAQGRFQPKANLSLTPLLRAPLTLHFSYGRGISSQDARGIAKNSSAPKVATTDFYQLGTSHRLRRVALSADLFLIDRSNEQVYVPDDGSLEFKGPSRSYGWEAKTSTQVTKHLSFNAGITHVSNAFYRGTAPRVYVDSASHTVANAGFTLASWRGMFASIRYRHVSGYRLDGLDSSIHAGGLDVVDISATRALGHGVELNLAVENLTSKKYYETQNYFESRLTPAGPAVYRVHGTPGYPLGVTLGLTWRPKHSLNPGK